MLEEVKKLLRVTGTAFDDEVQGLIDECKEDLRLVGCTVGNHRRVGCHDQTCHSNLLQSELRFRERRQRRTAEIVRIPQVTLDYLNRLW
jgi:hypothetical protein